MWEAVEAEAQPILDMVVTDSRLKDPIRPLFLTFGGEVEPGEPFAHMVENRLVNDALTARARDLGVALVGQGETVTAFRRSGERIVADLSSGIERAARLLRRRWRTLAAA